MKKIQNLFYESRRNEVVSFVKAGLKDLLLVEDLFMGN